MSRLDAQLKLRIPDSLRDSIGNAAKLNHRSMNSEIVARLLESFGELEAQPMAEKSKGESLTIRLSAELKDRLDKACEAGPYRISKTSIVERGIELAIQEITRMNAAGEDAA